MKKILISGFTTFADHSENSSQVIADRFKTAQIEGFEIQTTILPVAFSNAFEHLKIEIDSFKPDYIVCLGLAGNRHYIDLEKVAINLIHTTMPDNEGVLKLDTSILQYGPAAYFSTLPLAEMNMEKTPYHVEISFSAGAYVCNYLMYRVLDYVKSTTMRAGFIHLPHLKSHEEEIFQSLSMMMAKF